MIWKDFFKGFIPLTILHPIGWYVFFNLNNWFGFKSEFSAIVSILIIGFILIILPIILGNYFDKKGKDDIASGCYFSILGGIVLGILLGLIGASLAWN